MKIRRTGLVALLLAPALAVAAPAWSQIAGLDCPRHGAANRAAYEAALRQGTAANFARRFADSESAWRRAVELQQRACGRDDPSQVFAASHVALQQSNLGRFTEAEALFVRIEGMLAAVDAMVRARAWHNRALHANNRHAYNEALAWAGRAEQVYLEAAPQLRAFSELVAARRADFDRQQPAALRRAGPEIDSRSRIAAASLAELYRTMARLAELAGDSRRASLINLRADAIGTALSRDS
jgi:hypothetical protein